MDVIKGKFVESIFANNYEEVESYIGYFKLHNVPEGLNFIFSSNDYTPLTAACDVAENLGIVKLLIKYGADVNMRNGNGITPLEMAILNDSISYELTKYLLEQDADPTDRDDEGKTPLDLAIDIGEHNGVVDLLKDYIKYDYKTVQNLQHKVREKKTLKRNRAAKRIQSRRRGNLTRKRNYLSRYRSYKPWKGIVATDYYLYTDEDIFDYLRQDDLNFVLKLPSTMEEKYEAWNVNDILTSLKFNIRNREDHLIFYECLTPKHNLRPDNIDTNSEFIKIGSTQFIVKMPEWFYSYFYLLTPIVLPEPRIYTLKKYKMVNGLVSNKIYDYGHLDPTNELMVSGDHCNYPRPVQTYELVIEKSEDYMLDYVNYLNQPFLEEDYMADYLNMLNEYNPPSLPSNRSDSSELRRRIEILRETSNDTDDNDEVSELRNRLNRINDSSNTISSSDSDQSNYYNMEILMDIYFGRRSGNLTQRQREIVENYLSILEEQPDEYIPRQYPDAESDDSNISW